MSTPLYMVSVPLDIGNLIRTTRATSAADEDTGLLLHHCLSALFGKAALQPFWLAPSLSDRSSIVLGYSAEPAAVLEARARLDASPELHQAVQWDRLASKEMPATFAKGTTLGYTIRYCPVTRLASDREFADGTTFKRGSEIDVWLHRRLSAAGELTLARAPIYQEWFSDRLAGAANIDSFQMNSFKRVSLARKTHSSKRTTRRLERPAVEATGELTVAEPEKFCQLLARGVGRHRAFGFGMLLLRSRR